MSAPNSIDNNSSIAEVGEESSSTTLGMVPNNVASSSHALSTMPNDFRAALEEFRDSWKRELQQTEHIEESNNARINAEQTNIELIDHYDVAVTAAAAAAATDAKEQALAESLFQKAVLLEQRGKVYDALPFYRKAIQIVPDIEFKYYERHKVGTSNGNVTNNAVNSDINKNLRNSSEMEIDQDLYGKFQSDIAQNYNGKLFLKNFDNGVISTELHISDLPMEILFYILRWVISSQLDLRSLEQCAAVCKGFFLCARDEELWRLACLKVWDTNVGSVGQPISVTTQKAITTTTTRTAAEPTQVTIYNSWRQMFIKRERIHFNGCYISKTTYLRMGEKSFQDQYYRPVQLVEYFRYVRFLPDGTVLMMTSADEPAQGVNKLKQLQMSSQQRLPEVLRGYYRLSGNTVKVILHKNKRSSTAQQQQQQQYVARSRRGSTAAEFGDDLTRTTYCIEFRIAKTTKRRNYNHLIWLHYSIKQVRNKVEASSDFELTPSKYPPLWFSPVRSYHLVADAPLA